MRANNYIQVLWVENDAQIIEAYPREAEMSEELQLCPFPCWEKAEVALESDYNRWDAIILDAKCQYDKNDADKAEKFLSHVFPRIERLANRQSRTIPWYVLSGEGEDDIRDLIPDTNDWDEDWVRKVNRRFYSKNSKVRWDSKDEYERRVLFQRIKTQVLHYNHELQLRNDLYFDVFDAVRKIQLAPEIEGYLVDLLEPIHFKGTDNDDYNRRYIDLRKALEFIFRHMVAKGILPSILLRSKEKDEINLSWSSLFLGAKQPKRIEDAKEGERKLWKNIIRNTEAPLLPRQLADWLQMAIFQTGGAAHTSEIEEQICMNLEKYLPHVGSSSYMLRSLTFGLCDLILWYQNFLNKNPDEEKNALLWKIVGQKF